MSSFQDQNPHSCKYCEEIILDFREFGNDEHKATQIQRFKSIRWTDRRYISDYAWNDVRHNHLHEKEDYEDDQDGEEDGEQQSISDHLDGSQRFIFAETTKSMGE